MAKVMPHKCFQLLKFLKATGTTFVLIAVLHETAVELCSDDVCHEGVLKDQTGPHHNRLLS